MINPYSQIDWNNVQTVKSVSHAHATKGQYHNRYVRSIMHGGVKHLCISNYRPSCPDVLEDDELRYILMEQEREGDEQQAPFIESDMIGIVQSPNAQHFGISKTKIHLSSLGSNYYSQDPNATPAQCLNGAKKTANRVIKEALEQLVIYDGGGITINHPVYSEMTKSKVRNLLDYDSRVIGLEVFNATCDTEGFKWTGDGTAMWDAALRTGRKCYGFAATDHEAEEKSYISSTGQSEQWRGSNVLLLSQGEYTAQDCLRAYRNGQFYAQMGNTGLRFDLITYDGETLKVSAPGATKITVVTADAKTEYESNNISVQIAGKKYIRIEAQNVQIGNKVLDKIWSQPIMLVDKPRKRKKNRIK